MLRLRCLVVIGALSVAVGVVGAGPAGAAKGGNNGSAKLCQKGAWKELVPDAADKFVNQGDCVNDGAQGSATFGAAGKAACDAIKGQFNLSQAEWTCDYARPANFPPPPENLSELQTACETDTGPGGGYSTFPLPGAPINTQGFCVLNPT